MRLLRLPPERKQTAENPGSLTHLFYFHTLKPTEHRLLTTECHLVWSRHTLIWLPVKCFKLDGVCVEQGSSIFLTEKHLKSGLFHKIGTVTYLSSFSSTVTLACSASWSSCCSSKSLRIFRRTPSKRSTSPSLSSTCRFKAFTRRDSWGRTERDRQGVRGEQRRAQVKT